MQPLGIEENVLTIDSWQGREKEFMIMSAVRSNDEDRIGFLDSYRRINVALTRAQHGLIIIGNRMTLKSDEVWSAIIKHFIDNNCYCNNFEEAIEMIKRNSF
jgi:regulator of nonsense transcripts 1